ncbi:MAG: hypothetical protein AAF317_20045 [Pseudomonadota bacterium]
MPRKMLVLASLLCSSIAVAAPAQEDGSTVQTRHVSAEQHRMDMIVQSYGTSGPHRDNLSSERGISFMPSARGRGAPDSVVLDLDLEVSHVVSGMIGDGLPMEEAPTRVSTNGQLDMIVEIIDPDGRIIASERIQTAPIGCSARGTCMFGHKGTTAIHMTADVEARFAHGPDPVDLTLRLQTDGAMIDQICIPTGEWDYCQIDDVSIGISSRGEGARLTYRYDDAAVEGMALSASVVWENEPIALPPVVLAFLAGGLAIGMGVAALRRG